ncbi:hypothetical protein BO82DRAFT_409866 [Aspergillus uvarum CBS 121591]|uniref:Uncharacterized protein n=1 Tax=Aspergillus uvarum CBS 121591 TaxID=1448315 RepID=A0A319BTR2_9EURO|nr:hypothetical protein BO82DRAFT_409866 [Aspergillus uvarum CBS 121591]PYH75627.1 hypothetical protein BO82DRAFT_409866 [Aspergillus uvarum CBS 121591]
MSSRIKSVENKIQKSPQHVLVPCSELEKSLSMDPADVRAEPNLIERCFILMVANLINLHLENVQRKYSLTEEEHDVCGPVVGETLTTNHQASMKDLMIQMANHPSVPLRLLDRAREPSLLVAESQKGGTIATFREWKYHKCPAHKRFAWGCLQEIMERPSDAKRSQIRRLLMTTIRRRASRQLHAYGLHLIMRNKKSARIMNLLMNMEKALSGRSPSVLLSSNKSKSSCTDISRIGQPLHFGNSSMASNGFDIILLATYVAISSGRGPMP